MGRRKLRRFLFVYPLMALIGLPFMLAGFLLCATIIFVVIGFPMMITGSMPLALAVEHYTKYDQKRLRYLENKTEVESITTGPKPWFDDTDPSEIGDDI